MVDVLTTGSAAQAGSVVRHPLNPLTADEITAAIGILHADARYQQLGSRVRLITLALHEPPKDVVLAFAPGDHVERAALVILLDNAAVGTYEVVVSITGGAVRTWRHVPGVQPALLVGEEMECERVVKEHPDFQAALRRRGIADLEQVQVDPWPPGNFGPDEDPTRRLARAVAFVQTGPDDNGYARPIQGVVGLVDLNTMTVLRIDDHGVVPVPTAPGNFTPDAVGALRTDLKPLAITQPDGPSFTVQGYEVSWQKWRFRVGFTPREGLVLYQVGYEDQGRVRPILYRAALSEMVVPYGDPSPQHYFKNAFDGGENGVGSAATPLTLGCDCLGEIYYFDAVLADSHGNPVPLPHAICMHEEDDGVLWRHIEWRSGQGEVRRSRRLVVSSFSAIGNYDYGFFWYFYQDGSIQYEVKLTGVLATGAVMPGETPRHGTLVAPQLNAMAHQHFFNVRLDMDVDGVANAVHEVHTEPMPPGPENPYGNAFVAKRTPLATEAQAQRVIDPFSARSWEVVNPSARNSLGQPVGYRLVPGENVLPFSQPDASILKRAGFITRHLWVTAYDPAEMYAAGDYPYQHPGGAGLPAWTQANRALENRDVVLWYTFGHHHLPRPEEWPVMPVARIGFMLKPVGFFERNPALDVPPPASMDDACCRS